jgi:hypothetical protein
MSQLPEPSRGKFLAYIRTRLSWDVGCKKDQSSIFPKWDSLVSELPLVTEFLVRNGGKEDFFSTLEAEEINIIPGHVLMLMQLEEMIALNYTVFTEPEYRRLAKAVRNFGSNKNVFARKFISDRSGNTVKITFKGLGDINVLRLNQEITGACNALIEQCRKAEYLFLKNSLLENVNIEVNQDKVKVEGFLKRFGFRPLLSAALDEADKLYQDQSTAFDLKSCMGHLRSFLENLLDESMPPIFARFGGTPPKNWGGNLAYLHQNGVFSKTEEQFAAHFYTLMSDEGVHPLVAEKEYARLARNIVIEFALLFLTKLDKLGLIPAKVTSTA